MWSRVLIEALPHWQALMVLEAAWHMAAARLHCRQPCGLTGLFHPVFFPWKQQRQGVQGTEEGRGISLVGYSKWLALIWGLRWSTGQAFNRVTSRPLGCW